jgi:hypothetical protein
VLAVVDCRFISRLECGYTRILTVCLCKGPSKSVVHSEWVLIVTLTDQRDLCCWNTEMWRRRRKCFYKIKLTPPARGTFGKGKGKIHCRTGKKPQGLFSVLGGGGVVKATPRPLYPRERAVTYCLGRWVGLIAGLDGCGKSRFPPGLDPRTGQTVASPYTDCAIAARGAHVTWDIAVCMYVCILVYV